MTKAYNGHGDVTALIDEEGNVVSQYYYDAFGNLLESEGGVKNPYRYSGYSYDESTGLYYLNARMYDPRIARFMQEDTYTGNPNDPLSLNLYTYCSNNPLIYYDPSGHSQVPINTTGMSQREASMVQSMANNTIPTIKSPSLKKEEAVKLDPNGKAVQVANYLKTNASLSIKDKELISNMVGFDTPKTYSLREYGKAFGDLVQQVAMGIISLPAVGVQGVMSTATIVAYPMDSYYLKKDYQNHKIDRWEYNERRKELYENTGDDMFFVEMTGILLTLGHKANVVVKNERLARVVDKEVVKGGSKSGNGAFDGEIFYGDGLGKLNDKKINITEKGYKIVEEHIHTFDYDGPNEAMLSRLREALKNGEKLTGADASFYMHEVAESTMMKNGISYTEAHKAALQKYNVSPFSVYHKDVVIEFSSELGVGFKKFWNIR